MKRIALAMALCLSVPLSAQQSAPEIKFKAQTDFFKLPPDIFFGEAAGVAVNSKGHVFVFSRGGTTGPAYGAAAAQLLEFDADGKYVREIGHHLYAWSFAHSVRIDKEDNIWVADKGSDMVIKFSPEGRVLMVFGRKQEASDEGTEPLRHPKPPLPPIDGQFRQVTDMAWDAAGNTFVSDGYINSRVAKIDKNGNWIKSWGEPGSGPGQFSTPHSIATDDAGNVYVADRGNGRIQVFDGDGKYLREIRINVPYDHNIRPWMGKAPAEVPPTTEAPAPMNKTQLNGSPWAICITPGPHQVLFASDSYPGRIYKLSLDGKVLGVLGTTGHDAGQFGWIHELACPSENVLYAAELLNWRVQKLTLGSDTTPLPTPAQTSKAVNLPLNPALPTVFIVGDSTARNQADLGWGDHAARFFNTDRINVANRAIAGRSSRTFIEEGAWDRVLAEIKPGDYVLLQMGHNDGGALDGPKARGSLKGLGEETKDVALPDGRSDTVHTYGWYMRKYIADARAKGAVPILLTLTIRNIWTGGPDGKPHIERDMGYDVDLRQLAANEHVPLIDMANEEADRLEALGRTKTAELFPIDHTHTSSEGAELVAGSVVRTLREAHSPLAKYLTRNN
jgi:lysophospholipase L1-like esterase